MQTPTQPLRILFLGGTGYIGPHCVRAALSRGHEVSVFNRGSNNEVLPEGIEILKGDRDGDLAAIRDRDWDVVVDLASFVPGRVRSLGEALHGRVGVYVFISSVIVYDDGQVGVFTEESAVRSYAGSADPFALSAPDGRSASDYGVFKRLCEMEAERQFPGRALILRLGHIVGPGDWHSGFIYWLMRMEHGGQALVAGEPASPVQFVDVRDLATWSLAAMERNLTGVFNVTGPGEPFSLFDLVDSVRRESGGATTLQWVNADFVAANGGPTRWSPLLFWTGDLGANLMRMDSNRAISEGLDFRPLSETIANTRAWHKSLPKERQADLLAILTLKPDGSGVEKHARDWPAFLEQESQLIQLWRG